jgi:hypothetical protein
MSYKKLIADLRSLLEAVDRDETDSDATRAVLKAYWTAGRDAYAYTRETGELIKNIALDVGAANGALEKYVRFYRHYPSGYKEKIDGHPLNWSHYAALLYGTDKKAREFYLKNAARQDWSSHELRRRIRNNYYEGRYSAEGRKKKGGHRLKPIAQRLYTYAADVLKVVDGDTLVLDIDVGFFTKMEHKIRLRGINCPEKGTQKGDEAKKFVEEQLRVNELTGDRVKGTGQPATREPANPIVIIRSYKSMTEKFGRYLVDLWYLKSENDKEQILAEGLWLNQVLLDKGLAYKVE